MSEHYSIGFGIHLVDDSQRMQIIAGLAQLVAATLEAFFYSNANAFNSSAGLTYNIDKSFQCTTVSQEVINNQHMVCFGQESFGNNNVVCFAMGIGINTNTRMLSPFLISTFCVWNPASLPK